MLETHSLPNASPKLWTRHYVLMLAYGTFRATANVMMMTGIPLYAIDVGGDNYTAGLTVGVFMMAAIIVRPFFGDLSDNRSRRLVLSIGSGITAACFFSYPFVSSMGALLLMRAINGIGFSAETNAAGTVLADIIPKSRLSEGIGNFGISGVLAKAIGAPLALALVGRLGYPALFCATTAFGLCALVCSCFVDYEKTRPKIVAPAGENRKSIASLFEKAAIPPSLAMIFVAVAMGGQSFIPIFAATRNVENVGGYYAAYAAALLVAKIVGGRTADRCGAHRVVVPGYVLQLASFLVLAFARNMAVFTLSGAIYGLGMGLVEPLLNAVMVRNCPPDRKGAGSSTYNMALDVGQGVGPVIWGILSQRSGFTQVYLLCGASVILSTMTYYRLVHRGLKEELGIKDGFLL